MSKPQREDVRPQEPDPVTEASIESFPASDPPAFNASKPPQRRRRAAETDTTDEGDRPVDTPPAQPNGASHDERPTTAQLRGSVPSGRTMGVSSATEPSAAPFDTDDEAAGRAASAAAMRTTLAEEARPSDAASPATGAARRADSTRGLLIGIAVLAALALLAWLLLA